MKTVVIIDDESNSRHVLCQLLQLDGWQVFEAEDGEIGLQMVLAKKPDLIICDLLMPRFNGFQVCRALKNCPEAKPAPIIVISGRDYPADRNGALESGAQAFMAKPIKPLELRKLIAHVCSSESVTSKTANPPPNMFNDHPPKLKFWGVRGSIPSPGADTAYFGGNTSCLEVRADGELIILDAGSGIRPLGLALNKEFQHYPLKLTVLITHTHWDHIQGFPFFIPAYNPKNTVNILGYEGARHGLEETLSGQMESPYFPIGFKEMPGNITITELKDLNFSMGKVRVQAAYMNHPGICVGYRLFTSGGSITYIPDNEQFQRLRSFPSGVDQARRDESLEYARSQDQRMTEFVKDSDVLIVDSQYDAEEYTTHVGWGHSCVDDSVALAVAGKVKQLFLFHHDPAHDDAKIRNLVEHARQLATRAGSPVQIEAAREGLEVVLESVLQASQAKL